VSHSFGYIPRSGIAGSYGRNLKVTEANRRKGPGTREKVSVRRVNLECNTYVQENNARSLLV
jgi:hypothetical protein